MQDCKIRAGTDPPRRSDIRLRTRYGLNLLAISRQGRRSSNRLRSMAIGASCAFLTPIDHQNNALILGPGFFRFDNYWRRSPPDQRPRAASLARFSARFSSLVFWGFLFVSFFRSIPFDMTPAPFVG